MQLTTTNPFLELFPYDVTWEILTKAARTLKEFIRLSLVDHSFRKVILKTLSEIFRDCRYCSREEMNSVLLSLLNTTCQRLSKTASQKPNLRAKIPRPPIRMIMPEQSSEESPVCHILIITDADLKKPLLCDASQVHTLLVGLTDEQDEEERFNKLGRLVNFLTINRFPNLSSLVLNNVKCTNELLECFQKYNLEYLHIRYSSLNNYTDPKSTEWKYHLDKLATLTVEVLRIDISIGFQYCDFILDLSPTTRNLTLKIDVMKGSIPKSDSQSRDLPILMPLIDVNATNSKSPLNFQLFCDPLFSGIVTYNPSKEPCTKELICHAFPHQFYLTPTLKWSHEIVKLYIHEYNLRGTSFPKCPSPKYYNPEKPTSDDEDYIRGIFSDEEINYGNCELEMFLNRYDKNS
jgi:hypothetical protein